MNKKQQIQYKQQIFNEIKTTFHFKDKIYQGFCSAQQACFILVRTYITLSIFKAYKNHKTWNFQITKLLPTIFFEQQIESK